MITSCDIYYLDRISAFSICITLYLNGECVVVVYIAIIDYIALFPTRYVKRYDIVDHAGVNSFYNTADLVVS